MPKLSSESSKSLVSMLVRLPKKLHLDLRHRSKQTGLSLNKIAIGLLSGADLSRSDSNNVIEAPTQYSKLLDAVHSQYSEDLVAAALFGSVARGKPFSTSDIDLLIVLDRAVRIERELYSSFPMKKFEGREVSPIFVHVPLSSRNNLSSLWLEVALDGIILSDKNLILNRFLIDVRDQIARGQWIRATSHGQPYWIDKRLNRQENPYEEPRPS